MDKDQRFTSSFSWRVAEFAGWCVNEWLTLTDPQPGSWGKQRKPPQYHPTGHKNPEYLIIEDTKRDKIIVSYISYIKLREASQVQDSLYPGFFGNSVFSSSRELVHSWGWVKVVMKRSGTPLHLHWCQYNLAKWQLLLARSLAKGQLFYYLHSHVTPPLRKVYPGLQLHVRYPWWLVHRWSHPPLSIRHSFTSGK